MQKINIELIIQTLKLLLGSEGAEFRFRLFDAQASQRARNGDLKDDLNFSAIAHSDKQISQQISTIFSNALVETLLIKLGDSALYVLFGSYRKTEQITASRCFNQFKSSYDKVRVELGFFQASCVTLKTVNHLLFSILLITS